jgi:hypothetical protein
VSATVSVLVPTYQQASFLPRAISSLLAQKTDSWRAYILDDGSTDETPDIARQLASDSRVSYLRWGRNRGLGATLNAGLDAADSEFVAYLPSDDIWYADHLTSLLEALQSGSAVLAWSGVRHHHSAEDLDGPPGFGLQLVQAAHRRTADRWRQRDEIESDDLDLLFWRQLRIQGTARTGTVTCEWTDHPAQRHKAIRESYDGGLNVFRSRYRVRDPLRFHSSDSGLVDEQARYRRFRERRYPASPDGLRVLLVGELAFNPERVLALAEQGHRLFGLWTPDGLGDSTVGPLPFGHVEDIARDRWPAALRELASDVIYAQLNWRAVPFASEVMNAAPDLPFVWHFKEAPQRSMIRGDWPHLVSLVTRSDACLLATEEERDWFELAVPEFAGSERVHVMDGDLPKRDWLSDDRSPRLSEGDGEIHTAVVGRAVGLDATFLAELGARGVHTHFHGQVSRPGPGGDWHELADAARRLAPGYIHVHPAVEPNSWVSLLSRYDAGWLHRVRSANHGDLRRATWDDLNTPARLPVLLAAGLPPLVQRNAGHRVAVERIVNNIGAGVTFDNVDELVALLEAEATSRLLSETAWSVRERFTFDAEADRLSGLLTAVATKTATSRR